VVLCDRSGVWVGCCAVLVGRGAVWACMRRFKAVLLCGRVGVGVRRSGRSVGCLCGCGVYPGGGLTGAHEPGGSTPNIPKKEKEIA